MRRCVIVLLSGVFLAAGEVAFAQASASSKVRELLLGKLVYVAPMPAGLDQWILEFLQRWGKYRVTADPEGVDLYVEAIIPEEPRKPVLPKGVPAPPPEEPRFPLPGRCPRQKASESPAMAIHVVDWVTRESLWHAHLLDKKPKKGEPEPLAGPHTDILTRGMTPDQVAQRLVARLRAYVAELEKAAGAAGTANAE